MFGGLLDITIAMPLNSSYTFKESKNNKIQIFRALAIIAVVMIHTTPLGEWQVFCRPFINFSVAAFLFISGYLTKIENDDWPSFYKKRIVRVIIPYIIWTSIYVYANNRGITNLPYFLLSAQASAPLYYVFVYIQFVLLTPFLGKLAKSKYQILGWFVAPVSILFFKYYCLITGFQLNRYISLIWSDACLGWFTFYYLGLLLGNRILIKHYSLKNLIGLYLASIILQIAEGQCWLMLGETNCGTQIKLTSLLTSSLFLLITYTILNNSKIVINNKPLRLLGDYSFGIYLCHILIMHILTKIPFYSFVPYPITSAIVIIISFICCYIGHRICGERISRWIGFC